MAKKKETRKDKFLKEYRKLINSDEYQKIDDLIKEDNGG